VTDYPDCSDHEIVFVGMVNVNRDNYLQGVTDVWRCRKCRRLFCDDKRYDEPLKPSVGFDSVPDDEEWAVLTCTSAKEVYMQSLGIKPGKVVRHACKGGEEREYRVRDDWSIEPSAGMPMHRLFLVKDNINKNIEAGYYKLTMVK
jgi:hypothetical protein